ncbi:signal peptidase I [Butyrivibrio sp. AE2005]|uniref:signal peptidase I n=1 Tax=Butyrivibrio sp. AE2005 TaxID=1496722 RepID=UPI0009DDD68B|nr:signal peptidase I [Butyrivibrio sp. AE2005]
MIKKIINTCAFILILFFMMPSYLTVFAKEIPLELDKAYDACAFTVTTEKYGYYDVTVISPKKDEYKGTIDGSDSTEVLVKDVTAGSWKVRVEESHNESSMASEGSSKDIESQNDTDIGKVKVSVRGIDVSSYTIDKDIKVAKDINGLKMYFKDDNIEIEWSDQSVGNVVVTVTDTQTNVEISKESVKGNSFECEIPKQTKQITIAVVPATSSNIENAASQFTLDVMGVPNASVVYENKEFVNTTTIPVSVELRDKYALEFVVNDKVVEDVPMKDAGTYEYEIPVNEGENRIRTYIIDEKGNMRSTAYQVVKDSESPVLKLEREYDGAKTYNEKVTFEGTVTGQDLFTINDSEVKVSGDGVWKYEYELHDGDNSVVFKATDLAGNETVYPATVIRLIKVKKDVPFIPIIIGVILIVGVVFIIWKRKNPGNRPYNNMIDSIREKPTEKNTVVPAKNKKNGTDKKLNDIQRFGIELIIVVVAAVSIFKFVLIPFTCPSESMQPTIEAGSWGFFNGIAYAFKSPKRGDIISFYSKELDKLLCKRVIGLPGDTVSFYDGYVYINDGLVYEEYIGEDVETNSAISDFVVPKGCYFVLGDNRENSYDSRFWDDPYVKKSAIKGKWMTTLLHFDKDKR